MTFGEYQIEVRRTMTRPPPRNTPDWDEVIFALGLVGEAGEVTELVKKDVGHGTPFTAAQLAKELGDVLWYLTALADTYALNLADIAATNVAKLLKRYPKGFSYADSQSRKDES